jgi:lysophospholipase L1-like esterase
MLALGDSISCGEGVGVLVHPAHTWVAVLAHALDADLELLAGRGARTRDVRADQVAVALARPAAVTTLVIGLNDVSRSGWDAERVSADLHATVTALRASGTTLLLGRLHDPTRFLPLPGRVRARARQRIGVVNDVVDALRGPGVLVLDLDAVPELRQRSGWAVDRMHPSVNGHRGIAAEAIRVLGLHGIEAPNGLGLPSTPRSPGLLTEAIWLLRHALPFVLRHFDHRLAQQLIVAPRALPAPRPDDELSRAS